MGKLSPTHLIKTLNLRFNSEHEHDFPGPSLRNSYTVTAPEPAHIYTGWHLLNKAAVADGAARLCRLRVQRAAAAMGKAAQLNLYAPHMQIHCLTLPALCAAEPAHRDGHMPDTLFCTPH